MCVNICQMTYNRKGNWRETIIMAVDQEQKKMGAFECVTCMSYLFAKASNLGVQKLFCKISFKRKKRELMIPPPSCCRMRWSRGPDKFSSCAQTFRKEKQKGKNNWLERTKPFSLVRWQIEVFRFLDLFRPRGWRWCPNESHCRLSWCASNVSERKTEGKK